MLAKIQLESYIHPIIYLSFYIIGAIHFWMAVLQPQNQIVRICKYLDISHPFYSSASDIVLYGCSFLVFINFLWILRQLYASIKFKKLQIKTWEKYTIKIFSILGLLLSTALMMTILRIFLFYIKDQSSITSQNYSQIGSNLNSQQGQQNKSNQIINYNYYIAFVSLGIYLVVILPYEVFFNVDIEPFTPNHLSSLNYLNFQRGNPIFRVIICFTNIIQKKTHIGFILAIFPILMFWMFKYPYYNYKNDKLLRMIMYGSVYIMFIRIISMTGQAALGGLTIVVSVFFIGTMTFVAEQRASKIIYKKKVTQQTIQIVVSMLDQFEANMKFLPLFLLSHQEDCENPQCSCKTQKMQTLCKTDGYIYWFQILSNIIQKNYSIYQIRQMSKSKRIEYMSKYQDISIVYSSFMAKKLNRYNKALYILDATRIDLDQLNFSAFHFKTYYERFTHEMEIKMIYDTKQENVINQYANKYIDYQIKIIQMNAIMRKSVKAHYCLYHEIAKYDPDQKIVLKELVESYVANQDLNKIIKELTQISLQVYPLLFSYIYPYYKNVCNVQIPKSKKEAISIKRISDDLNRYSYDSKTAICTVQIANTSQIGNILHNNIFFEEFLGFKNNADAIKKLNVDDLLPFPIRKSHRKRQQNFILSGKYRIQSNKVLIVNKQGYICDIQLSVQIQPSLKQGFVASVFIFPVFRKDQDSILLCNQKGQILYYSQLFQEKILQTLDQQSIQTFNQVLRYQILKNIQKCNTTQICIKFKTNILQVSLKRKIYDQDKEQFFYILKINYFEKKDDDCLSYQIYDKDLISQKSEQKDNFMLITENSDGSQDTCYIENIKDQILTSFEKNNKALALKKRHKNYKKNTKASKCSFDSMASLKSKKNNSKLFNKDIIQINNNSKYSNQLQSQIKTKNQQNKLQNIFKIIQKHKTLRIVKCYIAVVIILSIIILALVLNFSVLGTKKIQLVRDSNKKNGRYQRLNIFLLDAYYNLRKANIQANIYKNQKKYQFYRQKFQDYKILSVDLYQYFIGKVNFVLNSYRFNSENGQVQQQQDSTFFLTIDWHIFPSLTNLATANMNEMDFEININKISQPYNNFKINFIQTNLNALHQIFPNFKIIKDLKYQSLNCLIGDKQCITNQYTIFLIPTCIILTLIILILSYYISNKIKKIKNKTLEILSNVTYQQLIYRKDILKNYRQQYFPQDKWKKIKQQRQKNKQKVFKVQQKYNNKTLKALPFAANEKQQQNQLYSYNKKKINMNKQINNNSKNDNKFSRVSKQFNNIRLTQDINTINNNNKNKNITGNFSNLSNLSFFNKNRICQTQYNGDYQSQTSNQNQSLDNSNENDNHNDRINQQSTSNDNNKHYLQSSKKYKPIQFNKQSSKLIIGITLIIGIVLILLYIGLMNTFLFGTQTFVQHFKNKRLIFDQRRIFKEIKLYTLELGLDDGIIYVNQTKSISKNLEQSISTAYQVQRNLTDTFLNKNSSCSRQKLADSLQRVNQHNICNRLQELQIVGDQYFIINQETCSNLGGKDYLVQGRRAALMAFLQTARILWMKNTACQPCGQSHQLNFIQNPSLDFMQQLDYYFSKIGQYQVSILNQQLQIKISDFLIQVFVQISIFCLLAPICLTILCIILKKQRNADVILIRSVFHIISNETFKKSNDLKQAAIQKIDYQFLK